ncbi:hypothetical protein [Streptomyces sp. A1547]|uniref:hypothetical protein n=1 Tax=Streptomyces sp. A1547 TaxID=2563105 RepID=UPI0026A9CB64
MRTCPPELRRKGKRRHCTYAATWVGTKLRWDLAVDGAERQALLGLAEDCPTTTVVYEPAV